MRNLKTVVLAMILIIFSQCENQETINNPIPQRVLELLDDTKESKTHYPSEPVCHGIDSNGVSYVVYEWGGFYYYGQWTTNDNYSENFLGSNLFVANDVCLNKRVDAWVIYSRN